MARSVHPIWNYLFANNGGKRDIPVEALSPAKV